MPAIRTCLRRLPIDSASRSRGIAPRGELYAGFDEICRPLLDRGFRLVSIYHFEHQNGLAGWAGALFVNPLYPRLATCA